MQNAGYAIGGRHQRVPRGFEDSEPAGHLLKYRALFVHLTFPSADAIDGVRLMEACDRLWPALAPLNR